MLNIMIKNMKDFLEIVWVLFVIFIASIVVLIGFIIIIATLSLPIGLICYTLYKIFELLI